MDFPNLYLIILLIYIFLLLAKSSSFIYSVIFTEKHSHTMFARYDHQTCKDKYLSTWKEFDDPPTYKEQHLTTKLPTDSKFIPIPLNFSIPGECYHPADPLNPPPPMFERHPPSRPLSPPSPTLSSLPSYSPLPQSKDMINNTNNKKSINKAKPKETPPPIQIYALSRDLCYGITPIYPIDLALNDVFQDDWIRFTEDLVVTARYPGDPGPDKTAQRSYKRSRYPKVAYFLDTWNKMFFNPRKIRVDLYEEKRNPRLVFEFLDE